MYSSNFGVWTSGWEKNKTKQKRKKQNKRLKYKTKQIRNKKKNTKQLGIYKQIKFYLESFLSIILKVDDLSIS